MVVGIVLRQSQEAQWTGRGDTYNIKDMGTCTLAAEATKLTM